MVFAFNAEHPLGGMDDFFQDFDELEEAKMFLYSLMAPREDGYNFGHIFNILTNEVVHEDFV
jgi:hypothetical protein